MSDKNLFARIAVVKGEMSKAKLPKTGYNSYTKFKYFQLDDFEPTLESLCAENGIVTWFRFTTDSAEMIVVNVDNPDESITVPTPVHVATGKGGTPMQDIGAMQTYARRYLFMSFFGITESDSLDAVLGADGKESNTVQSKPKQSEPPSQQKTEQAKQEYEQSTGPKTDYMTAWKTVLKHFGYDGKQAKESENNKKALNDSKALLMQRYNKDSVMELTSPQVDDLLASIANTPENFVSDDIPA